MHNWAKCPSVVRCTTCFILFVATEAASFAQAPIGSSAVGQRPATNAVRSYGGWTRSQTSPSNPSPNTTAPAVQRASYYQQLDALPNFPDALPSQPISDLRDDGGALANSLSDMPLNSSSQQFDPRAVPNDPQLKNLGYDNPPQRLVPVEQAAFQSGQNSVMPPPQQFPTQQQFSPQQQFAPQQQIPQQQQFASQQLPSQPALGGNTQLRQAREITTGLPHVTPAPAQRYPTSPYMGRPRYMNAAYQRTTTVNYPNQQPGNNGSVLPQNLPPNPQPVFTNATPGVYPTAYPQQCPPTLPPDGAVGAYVPPTITPNWNPNMYSSNNSGYRPFLSLGQENYNVVLGRGILGQPTAYVPGQYVRNFLRYIFP